MQVWNLSPRIWKSRKRSVCHGSESHTSRQLARAIMTSSFILDLVTCFRLQSCSEYWTDTKTVQLHHPIFGRARAILCALLADHWMVSLFGVFCRSQHSCRCQDSHGPRCCRPVPATGNDHVAAAALLIPTPTANSRMLFRWNPDQRLCSSQLVSVLSPRCARTTMS
eukprot:SAG31_NODE_1317_length_8836_cov_3.151311_5_plen_167_part_00